MLPRDGIGKMLKEPLDSRLPVQLVLLDGITPLEVVAVPNGARTGVFFALGAASHAEGAETTIHRVVYRPTETAIGTLDTQFDVEQGLEFADVMGERTQMETIVGVEDELRRGIVLNQPGVNHLVDLVVRVSSHRHAFQHVKQQATTLRVVVVLCRR